MLTQIEWFLIVSAATFLVCCIVVQLWGGEDKPTHNIDMRNL